MKPTSIEAYQFFHEATQVLAEVEHNGIRIDVDYLNREIDSTKIKIRELDELLYKDDVYYQWRKKYGEKTNLNSRDQMGEVFFNILNHDSALDEETRYTKSGNYRANEEAFANVDHPFIQSYFQRAKLTKALSTYLLGIRREVDEQGFLHPSFQLAGGFTDEDKGGAASYRGSCSMPNFQNFPKRNKEIAQLVRRSIIPREGRMIVEIDFSGIEVRVGCFYHFDQNMIKYIVDPTTDMHRDTAMDLFKLKQDQVNKRTTRDCAKNQFVFPQFYGSTWFKCAENIWDAMNRRDFRVGVDGITIREHLKNKGIDKLGSTDPQNPPEPGTFAHHVKGVEEILWGKRFPQYAQWKWDWWNEYCRNGYYELLTGFVISNPRTRRQACNDPIQGVAFHLLLMSKIILHDWLKKHKMRSLIIGNIHDSIVMDCHPDELEDVVFIARRIMTHQLPKIWKWINVPLSVEVESGGVNQSWNDLKEIDL